MAFPCKKLSQVKLSIKEIVGNLQLLTNCKENDLYKKNLRTNTEHLLTQLENFPLERLKKRQKKRQKRKLTKIAPQGSTNVKTHIDAGASKFIAMNFSRETEEKLGCHFGSIKECKRFLQTFELLEQLHLSRGHNSSETYKFELKLRQLKTIWNCLLQDKLQEQTSIDVSIQQQWNEVLFGPSEKTYFHRKPNLQDFIRKRQIWDSYIDGKFGSSIPVGWIIPDEQVNEQWQPYLAQ